MEQLKYLFLSKFKPWKLSKNYNFFKTATSTKIARRDLFIFFLQKTPRFPLLYSELDPLQK